MENSMLVRNRVPKHYFRTSGRGESDITVHAGSYHLALREAGIEMANIMTYSSILPGIAEQIDQGKYFPVHGEVMESIVCDATCEVGSTATAGIITGRLFDEGSEQYYGGLVCEQSGSDPEHVEELLRAALNELHQNGYERFDLRDIQLDMETVTPTKRYGTALVALCFTSYEVATYDSTREHGA
jgi:arginine decarboxylase